MPSQACFSNVVLGHEWLELAFFVVSLTSNDSVSNGHNPRFQWPQLVNRTIMCNETPAEGGTGFVRTWASSISGCASCWAPLRMDRRDHGEASMIQALQPRSCRLDADLCQNWVHTHTHPAVYQMFTSPGLFGNKVKPIMLQAEMVCAVLLLSTIRLRYSSQLFSMPC